MKVKSTNGYFADDQDRQYFERKHVRYGCVQVEGQNFTQNFMFDKEFAEWLVETQPFSKLYNQEFTTLCEEFKQLSAKFPQYAGRLQLLFQKLAPSFVRVDLD